MPDRRATVETHHFCSFILVDCLGCDHCDRRAHEVCEDCGHATCTKCKEKTDA